jgi:phosphopantothenoylcysteine decarboxylase/phosphopantothenate--cysteine ligase
MRHGAEVYGVMSAMAQKIVHPDLIEWATGNPVVTELTGQIEHITLAGKHEEHVDLVLIAPATANTIGKIANGIDDTPVTTTVSSAIGAGIEVLIVPAMHESMYDHPAVIKNIEVLRGIGVHVMNPKMEEAKAKIPEVDAIVNAAIALLGPKDLQGMHFLITAGPTRGWIDRVRFITNPSTGKMGIAIVEEAIARGAEVTLIIGPTEQRVPDRVNFKSVDTSKDMLDAVMTTLSDEGVNVLVSTAAVLDYTPEKTIDKKIESGGELTVKLVPTRKIIEEARAKHKGLFIVGFKVESGVTDEELESRAHQKIESGTCNLVVANDAQRPGVAFGTDTNEVLIVGQKGLIKKIPIMSKREIARHVVNAIVKAQSTHK